MRNGFRHAALASLAAAGLALSAAPASGQLLSDGFKFLEAVEKQDRRTVVELTSRNKTIVDARDLTNGRGALHIAVQKRDLGWLDYLISLGANPNLAAKDGSTPLTLAAQSGFSEGVALLSARGARVDVANNTGETPLISAVHRRDLGLLRILMRAGADPDRTDNSGRSARDYAALDVGGAALLAEIDRLDTKGAKEKPAQVYGPAF